MINEDKVTEIICIANNLCIVFAFPDFVIAYPKSLRQRV